jgi:hypothetical protein
VLPLLIRGRLAASLVAALVGPAVLAAPVASAASRELVVVDENLAVAEHLLPQHFEQFLRRLEQVTGWPRRSLRGKTLLEPRDALAVIKKSRAGFAIVPVHQLVQGRKELKLEVLARVAGLEGRQLNYVAITPRPKPFKEVSELPVLKIATIEPLDPVWFHIVSDGAIGLAQPLDMKPARSSRDALRLAREKQVDIALVSPTVWKEIEPKTTDKGDLDVAFSSPKLPVAAFVAVGKYVSAADKKALAAALGKVCREDGADVCGRMGIMFIEPGRQDVYDPVIKAYDQLSSKK